MKINGKSLRFKLLVSHISMVVIPVLLILLTEFAWTHIEKVADYSSKKVNPMEEALKSSSDVIYELDNQITTRPDVLLGESYFEKLDQIADEGYLFVVIKKDDKLVYVPDGLDLQRFDRTPLESGDGKKDGRHGWRDSPGYFLIQQRSFQFSDGSSGQIYFLYDEVKHGALEEVVFVMVFLLGMLINVFISYRISNRIISPLRQLNEATGEISKGNLDCTIECSTQDEVGELCRSFDHMRVQLKEANSLSQRYENNRKELIANISHDLKTPITSILGYVEGIMEGVANSPEKMDKYTKTIYSNAVDMDHLIDELFLFSKLDLNQITFDFESIDIEEYLKDCVEEKTYDLGQKGIRLEYETHLAEERTVIGDRLRLQRVINNILQNSEQHRNPDNGESFIKIGASDYDREVVIEIKDNGKGIPEESLPHIFDRLYRVDPSRNRQIKGSGLGLSIAKHIVEAHGGRIWAESTEGAGTSIYFTLCKIGPDNISEEAGA